MYHHSDIPNLILSTESAITETKRRFGISIYVEGDPDIIGPNIYIDPADEKGIALFREFAAKMVEHYKSLSDGR